MNKKTGYIILVVIVLSAVGISYTLYRAGIIFPKTSEINPQNPKTIYFAPYVNSTHSCYTHASSCAGELNNTEISYIITSSNGSIHINGSAITGANGFFELSFPANNNFTIEFSVIISSEIYTGNTTFETYPNTANCITTGQVTIKNPKTIYFAPYVNSTHSCYTHASSCTGELKNTEISYIITSSDGSIHINGSAITRANGFFELNLPANNNFTVEFSVIINGEIYTGSTTFETYPNSANCITTGQLTT